MSKKRKQRKRKRSSSTHHRARRPRAPSRQELETALERADELIWQGNPHQAVELLQPFLETHPRHAELHYYLGYAHAKAGDAWAALPEYEQAQDLGDGHYWLPLASLYLECDQRVHALRAFRQALQHSDDFPIIGDIPGAIEALEQEVADLAHSLSLPVERAETGLYHMERGRRALSERDFPAAITFSPTSIARICCPTMPLSTWLSCLIAGTNCPHGGLSAR